MPDGALAKYLVPVCMMTLLKSLESVISEATTAAVGAANPRRTPPETPFSHRGLGAWTNPAKAVSGPHLSCLYYQLEKKTR